MLKWYGHVKRMDERNILRRMLDAPVPRKRRKGAKEIWKVWGLKEEVKVEE